MLSMIYKMGRCAEKSWRRLRGFRHLAKVIKGVRFNDGIEDRKPFATGGGPASAKHPVLSWVNTLLGNLKRSMHGSYHHVSSKHLPRYLAEFSYRFNRRFSLRERFPRLAYVALRTPPMPNRVLKLAENYA